MRGHGNEDSPKKHAFPDGDEEGDDADGAGVDELDAGSDGVQESRSAGCCCRHQHWLARTCVCVYIHVYTYTYIHTHTRLTVLGAADGEGIKVHKKTGSWQHVSLAASARVYACFRVCL
jgi:hypothetical protein